MKNDNRAGLGELYFHERGVLMEIVRTNGVTIEVPSRERAQERLGETCVHFWKEAKEVIWFPGPIARPLPTFDPHQKFLSPAGNAPAPFIPILDKSSGPLLVTEGPVKALVLAQAGFRAVGVNG